MTKFILGLGDKQYPMADLTYVGVEAESIDLAKQTAKAKKTWAFVMSCIPADHDHFRRYPQDVTEWL